MRKHSRLWSYFLAAIAAFFSYNAFLAGYPAVGFLNGTLSVLVLYVGLGPSDGASI